MKLQKFRVQNFRSIVDSGWVELDDIAVIVGKNESGKTSLLKALWKLNPFDESGYLIDREWPRGRRKEKSPDKIVCTAIFSFSAEESAQLAALHDTAQGITSVEVSRNYAGRWFYAFQPSAPDREHPQEWVIQIAEEKLEPDAGFSDHFKNQYRPQLDEFLANAKEGGEGSKYILENAKAFKAKLPQWVYPHHPQHQQDQVHIAALNKRFDDLVADITATPIRKAADLAHSWLPTFIYMDDHKAFQGSAQLDALQERKKQKKSTSEDETVELIMEMAGLDLDEEVAKGKTPDREQRILDMNDASQTLTNLISSRWKQKKYEVVFQADGQHLLTFVKDEGTKALVPLEERSKGFQWFFSFDMTFMYETDGKFSNAIILLDEPGLHLHAAAQRDLLERMKAYAESNQLIYTTHLPFMIDFTSLDNIWVAEEIPEKGSVTHKNWAIADKDARFTLQAALGLSWSQSLFVGQYNLVVEGVTDFWALSSMSEMLKAGGMAGLDDDLVITPAGGASKVAYVGTILSGQELNVCVLLDADPEGQAAYDQLVKQWILDAKLVLMLDKVVSIMPKRGTLEDLFDRAYYLSQVHAAYTKELAGTPLALATRDAGVVELVEEALVARGVPVFNKGRVAKLVLQDFAKKGLKNLDKSTVENFTAVFEAINKIVGAWKDKKPQSKGT